MDHQKFNDIIADSFGETDPELRNHLATHHGRCYAGVSDGQSVQGICPRCQKEGQIATRRRNCAYNDDKLNWLTSCRDCFDEDSANFEEMWADYYSMTR